MMNSVKKTVLNLLIDCVLIYNGNSDGLSYVRETRKRYLFQFTNSP
jgi:hypothetical protein